MSGDGASSQSSDALSICFVSKKGRKVASISKTASLKDLHDLASSSFGGSLQVSSLKCGFPPKSLSRSSEATVSSVVQPQERIHVQFSVNGSSDVDTANGTNAGTVTTSTGLKRSKRAASKRASAAMPAIIKAQEDAMQQQTSRSSSNSRSSNRQNRSTGPLAGGNVAGFGASARAGRKPSARSAAAKRPARARLSAAAGDGRRLDSGEIVKNPSSKRRRVAGSKASSPLARQKHSSDMSEALLDALNHKGKMGQVLRKGMKNAVQSSYETSRAFARLAAIQSDKYTITTNGHSGDGRSTEATTTGTFVVSFSGSVDKRKITESVDSIPREVLEAVIKGIHASNREALRPENLSLLSPRVLWSLVHHFPNHPSVDDCLRLILPDLDWSFLRRRAVQLSAKAKENLRQQESIEHAAGGGNSEDAANSAAGAAEAILAVEHAMEHLQQSERSRRTSEMAAAAEARMQRERGQGDHQPQQQGGNVDDTAEPSRSWHLVTPSETDREELEQCIRQAPPRLPGSMSQEGVVDSSCGDVGSVDEDRLQHLIDAMLEAEIDIHNWRQLADVTDVPALAQRLKMTEQQVQTWVDFAQGESVGEIMVEVCGNNLPAVEQLTMHARTGTPKDLAAWRSIPEMLIDAIQQASSDTAFAKARGEVDVELDVETLRIWCNRAHELLHHVEWLNWYATPVE